MFNKVLGSTSLTSNSNDINDPLNPNNPINRKRQQQVASTVARHNQQQAQAKKDYQQQFQERSNQIASRKRLRDDAHQSRENSNGASSYKESYREPSGPGSVRTEKNAFMSSKIEDEHATGVDGWDCVNDWRAAKCGDRIVTHTLNPLAPGYTGEAKGDATSTQYSNQSNGAGENGSSFENNSTQASSDNSSSKKQKSQAEAYAVCKIGSCGKWICEGPNQGYIVCGDGSETLLQELSSSCNRKVNDRLGSKLSQGGDKDWVKYSCGHTCGDAVINISSYKERLNDRGFNLPRGCY